ncbi:MAG: hypothetical protein JWO86_2183 [Myxococcaceae bacterium]|jgi:hypothetical protein|nr:hypothetical protein [Myxococcaceae bacterium]MEA2747977.1 hypothetical protein [Myxococcales bacterium]
MKFPRSLAFFAVVPVALVVLAQGCSSGSTGGACAVIVDDAGPADQGRCASGPKQGKSCCVSSTASCASTLPLCQSICCITTSDGGDGPLLTDDEGGTTDATFFEASTFDAAHPDGATSSCPGNTKQTAPLLNATCQAALEKVCCAELKACFNIAAGASSDCNAYAACISSCASQADPTTCQTDCDSMTTTSIRNAYDTLVTCATNSTGTACQ